MIAKVTRMETNYSPSLLLLLLLNRLRMRSLIVIWTFDGNQTGSIKNGGAASCFYDMTILNVLYASKRERDREAESRESRAEWSV